jgi:hypothetical protein
MKDLVWEIFKNEQSPLYEVVCWRNDKSYDVKFSCDDPDEAQTAFDCLSGVVVSTTPPAGKRFCGRCQAWLPAAVELHHCVKAPRVVGYAWYEPDEPAVAKNSILEEGRKFKRGKLIAEFPS